MWFFYSPTKKQHYNIHNLSSYIRALSPFSLPFLLSCSAFSKKMYFFCKSKVNAVPFQTESSTATLWKLPETIARHRDTGEECRVHGSISLVGANLKFLLTKEVTVCWREKINKLYSCVVRALHVTVDITIS